MLTSRARASDLPRRPVEAEERAFLTEQRAVTGTLAELGLTALRSADVMDVLFQDFPDKYEQFRRVLDERRVLEVQKAQGEAALGGWAWDSEGIS